MLRVSAPCYSHDGSNDSNPRHEKEQQQIDGHRMYLLSGECILTLDSNNLLSTARNSAVIISPEINNWLYEIICRCQRWHPPFQPRQPAHGFAAIFPYFNDQMK